MSTDHVPIMNNDSVDEMLLESSQKKLEIVNDVLLKDISSNQSVQLSLEQFLNSLTMGLDTLTKNPRAFVILKDVVENIELNKKLIVQAVVASTPLENPSNTGGFSAKANTRHPAYIPKDEILSNNRREKARQARLERTTQNQEAQDEQRKKTSG